MGFNILGIHFDIDDKYSFVKALGQGAYGMVCAVVDKETGHKVAVKKIQPFAKSVNDAKHTLREIRLLRYCSQHPNVITLYELILNNEDDDLYIVMECMDTDLNRIIRSSQALSFEHTRHFMFQLLQGVEFLHNNGILHRDLKPANLLVSKNCDLRISDFGLARLAPHSTECDILMTEHVVTRWYRAPELILCPDGRYSGAVDIWSCGCILAELMGRTPLFPGKNFMHQLRLIFEIIGTPNPETMDFVENRNALEFMRRIPRMPAISFDKLYPRYAGDGTDLLANCLIFRVDNRISVSDALKHEFFATWPPKLKAADSPKLYQAMDKLAFDQYECDKLRIRKLITDEVIEFNSLQNTTFSKEPKCLIERNVIREHKKKIGNRELENQITNGHDPFPLRRQTDKKMYIFPVQEMVEKERLRKKSRSFGGSTFPVPYSICNDNMIANTMVQESAHYPKRDQGFPDIAEKQCETTGEFCSQNTLHKYEATHNAASLFNLFPSHIGTTTGVNGAAKIDKVGHESTKSFTTHQVAPKF